MNRYSNYIVTGLWLSNMCLYAQEIPFSLKKKNKDSITQLREVKVYSFKKLNDTHKGQKVTTIGSKEISRNFSNFTETLRFNSPVAFRDLGHGGVSLARFRGTSPTNTSVLWNDVPINAVGNGQTDFNALSVNTIDEIKVISGGSSVAYGSGAIGGTILINDHLNFSEHQNIQLFSSTGSFTTSNNFIKVNIGKGRWAFKLSGAYNRSDNDYEFLDTRFKDEEGNTLKNKNADYENYNIDASVGYKISNSNKLFFYTTKYEGDRFFSAGLPNPSSGKERNQDFNQRNLLKWDFQFSKFSQSINVAYLTQEYRYFNNRFVSLSRFSFGKSKSWFANYSLKYKYSDRLSLDYFTTYENILGYTDRIAKRTRTSLAFGGNINYKPFKSTTTAISIRNENNSDFSIPVVLSLAAEQKIGTVITLKANVSTNYRIPTYNELFWPVVGNLNLLPETSKQLEFGGDLKGKKIAVSATYFYLDLKNKIQWLPSSFSNNWRPRNLEQVIHRGFEISANTAITILNKHQFNFTTNFTQTTAKDVKNKKRLAFVPKHVFNFNLDYTLGRYNLYLQGLYQSKVFITEERIDRLALKAFTIYNLGANIKLLSNTKHQLNLGGKASNVLNTLYYFTRLRPNPGRNFSININYKF